METKKLGSKMSTKMLVEAGIMIALAFVLSKIKIFEGPQGGSVTAGSMIPILLFALRWGVGPGIITGTAFGLLKLFLGGWFFSVPQVILEYPIAFGVLGLAGLFAGSSNKEGMKYYLGVTMATLIAIGSRFICHFLAGIIFFADYAPEGTSPVLHSLIYQSSYLIPEFIISAIILALIWKPVQKAIGTN